jgi:hypothetical protein
MNWRIDARVGNQLIILISANPDGLSMVGVPGFRTVRGGLSPISASLGSGTLILQFGVPLDYSDELVIGSQDPSVRGAQGEYLTPDTQGIGPAPGLFGIAPTISAFEVVAANPTVPLNEILLGAVLGWRTYPTGIPLVSWMVDSNNLFMTFQFDVSGETGLIHDDGWAQNIALNGGRIRYGEYPFNP